MNNNILNLSIYFFLIYGISSAQEVKPLYIGEIPNSISAKSEEYSNAEGVIFKTSKPTLTAYFPEKTKANGTAIIICPGGGYGAVVMKSEGYTNAEKLRDLGYACFILKYRLPDDSTMKDKSIGPVQDLQKAIKTVRKNAEKWNISPNKIGVMGFSAGGHLASTAGTHFNKSFIENNNNTSLRPDFMILVYPIISMQDDLTHKGSQTNLLGENPTQEQINYFSNELQVSEQTPPTFLIQATDDALVKVDNSIAFYEALKKKKVPVSMLIYPAGNHGFPLEPAKSNWFISCVAWLNENQ